MEKELENIWYNKKNTQKIKTHGSLKTTWNGTN
jgi:hypothetical protein